MKSLKLLTPLETPELSFANRVFMALMTRSRAPERVPTALMKDYYAQRASGGLIFSEATQTRGGLILLQLMHTGRISHPSLLPAGATPSRLRRSPPKAKSTPRQDRRTSSCRALSIPARSPAS